MCGGGGDTRVREPESQAALAEQAAINLRRYGEIFVPLENQFIETTLAQFDDRNYERAMGNASTRIAGLYEQGINDFRNAAFQRGLDPTSGAFQAESGALRAAQARGMGQGMADAGMSNTDQGLSGLTSIVRMGQGLSNDAMQGQMALAEIQLGRARSQANLDFQSNSSLMNALGTGAGMIAGYALPGTQRSASYGL